MSKQNNLTDFLTGVANAIRTKKGTYEAINPQNFESEIESIETGGGFTPTNYSGTLTFTRETPNLLFFLRVDNNGNIEMDYTSYMIYNPGSTVQFTNVSAVFMDCSNFGGIVDVQDYNNCTNIVTGLKFAMFRIDGVAPTVNLRDD